MAEQRTAPPEADAGPVVDAQREPSGPAVGSTNQLPSGGSPTDIRKVSFNLYQSDVDKLRDLATGSQTNSTQALRNAIATEFFLREAFKNGERIILEGLGGQRREIIFR